MKREVRKPDDDSGKQGKCGDPRTPISASKGILMAPRAWHGQEGRCVRGPTVLYLVLVPGNHVIWLYIGLSIAPIIYLN